MRRTRKWSYVAQEAVRLADLGLSPVEIAKRLSVQRQTVQRWMQAGKLKDTRRGQGAPAGGVLSGRSGEEWGAAVRASYALDSTDEELVRMGEAALVTAHDPKESMSVRLSAMGRFQAIVKQLALVARNADVEKPESDAGKTVPPARVHPAARDRVDPRRGLMAVK